MIWHCEDCHKTGFYWDKTSQQIQDEHMKECRGVETIPDATGYALDSEEPKSIWPEGSEL